MRDEVECGVFADLERAVDEQLVDGRLPRRRIARAGADHEFRPGAEGNKVGLRLGADRERAVKVGACLLVDGARSDKGRPVGRSCDDDVAACGSADEAGAAERRAGPNGEFRVSDGRARRVVAEQRAGGDAERRGRGGADGRRHLQDARSALLDGLRRSGVRPAEAAGHDEVDRRLAVGDCEIGGIGGVVVVEGHACPVIGRERGGLRLDPLSPVSGGLDAVARAAGDRAAAKRDLEGERGVVALDDAAVAGDEVLVAVAPAGQANRGRPVREDGQRTLLVAGDDVAAGKDEARGFIAAADPGGASEGFLRRGRETSFLHPDARGCTGKRRSEGHGAGAGLEDGAARGRTERGVEDDGDGVHQRVRPVGRRREEERRADGEGVRFGTRAGEAPGRERVPRRLVGCRSEDERAGVLDDEGRDGARCAQLDRGGRAEDRGVDGRGDCMGAPVVRIAPARAVARARPHEFGGIGLVVENRERAGGAGNVEPWGDRHGNRARAICGGVVDRGEVHRRGGFAGGERHGPGQGGIVGAGDGGAAHRVGDRQRARRGGGGPRKDDARLRGIALVEVRRDRDGDRSGGELDRIAVDGGGARVQFERGLVFGVGHEAGKRHGEVAVAAGRPGGGPGPGRGIVAFRDGSVDESHRIRAAGRVADRSGERRGCGGGDRRRTDGGDRRAGRRPEPDLGEAAVFGVRRLERVDPEADPARGSAVEGDGRVACVGGRSGRRRHDVVLLEERPRGRIGAHRRRRGRRRTIWRTSPRPCCPSSFPSTSCPGGRRRASRSPRRCRRR